MMWYWIVLIIFGGWLFGFIGYIFCIRFENISMTLNEFISVGFLYGCLGPTSWVIYLSMRLEKINLTIK